MEGRAKDHVAPEDAAGWLGLVTFSLVTPFIKAAAAKADLQLDDVPPLPAGDRAKAVYQAFDVAMQRTRSAGAPEVLLCLQLVLHSPPVCSCSLPRCYRHHPRNPAPEPRPLRLVAVQL